MTAEQIKNKYTSLSANTIIRISDKPIYAQLNDKLKALRLWSGDGFRVFGDTEVQTDDLYFATTRDYTIIILLDESLDDEFYMLVSSAKSLIESSDNPEEHVKILKKCFDAWR